MGFFNRTNQETDKESADEDLALPTADDFKQPLVEEAEARSLRYGIDDAIKLLRTLPADNDKLVIKVLKSTLESTGIQVGDIVTDAGRKEESIRRRRKALHDEISSLQKQMDERHRQMEALKQDLDETISVRNRLQSASEKDRADQARVAATARTAVAGKPAEGPTAAAPRKPSAGTASGADNPAAAD